MARLQRKRFEQPVEIRHFPHGQLDIVELDDVVVGRMTHEPGWRWSVHVRPIAGTDRCQYHHVGYTIQGRLHTQLEDGAEMILEAGDVFELPPGHDAWVEGDENWVALDFAGVRSYAQPADQRGQRVLASLLFSDIVGSTALAERLGSAAWHERVGQHNERAQAVVDRFQGRIVDFTGDGFAASFDGAERAIRAALTFRPWVNELDLHVRMAVHTGEVESQGSRVRGLPLHIASRIMNLAGPDEILVSGTVHDLLDGSELSFSDRGRHELKGVSGARQVFAVDG
ncbi:MAG TPA: adenylate/guanylate cyclase domain-containing protein [Candidatus Limnocylindrales bacterium]|nr:adenylate/guanylate cyclase domain-containing protein [Candidatus Limnocylindrales bacterium]